MDTNEMNAVMRALAELSGKMDNMSGRLSGVETTVDDIRKQVVLTNDRLDAVETRLGTVEERLGTVEERLGTVETRIERLEDRMDDSDDRQRLAMRRLDKRLKAMEDPSPGAERREYASANSANIDMLNKARSARYPLAPTSSALIDPQERWEREKPRW